MSEKGDECTLEYLITSTHIHTHTHTQHTGVKREQQCALGSLITSTHTHTHTHIHTHTQVSEKGDQCALECLVTSFADNDAMVRHVALEAAEQLLDTSLTSVLFVLDILRSLCQVVGGRERGGERDTHMRRTSSRYIAEKCTVGSRNSSQHLSGTWREREK